MRSGRGVMPATDRFFLFSAIAVRLIKKPEGAPPIQEIAESKPQIWLGASVQEHAELVPLDQVPTEQRDILRASLVLHAVQ